MASLEELGSLPPITVELELFDYVALDNPREPPPVELRARLARRFDTDEENSEGLRLAFVAGRPVDSDNLLVLAYVWRPAPNDVVWGAERWPSPERRLGLYEYDPTFGPRTAAAVHAELKNLNPAAFADYARGLLGS